MDQGQNIAVFQQEISLMWSVSFHPNVITLLGYCDSPRQIIVEMMETDLLNVISTKPQILNQQVAIRILGISLALKTPPFFWLWG